MMTKQYENNKLEWMSECSQCRVLIPSGHAHPTYPNGHNGQPVQPTLMGTQLCDTCFATADPMLESLRQADKRRVGQ